jgi:hypothetical protein
MMINWNNYTFDLCHDGSHYLAICQRSGKPKTRHDRNVWYNDNGTRVTDTGLLECLEAGVSDWQRQHAHKPRASRNGHVAHTAPALRREARPKWREGETRS